MLISILINTTTNKKYYYIIYKKIHFNSVLYLSTIIIMVIVFILWGAGASRIKSSQAQVSSILHERPCLQSPSILQASFFPGVILAMKKTVGFAKEKASDLSEKGPIKPL